MRNRPLLWLLVAALWVGGCGNVVSESPTPAGAAPSRAVTFATGDGVTLSGTLYGEGGAVGVVLSHMFPTDQTSWHAFARTLADNGYQALAYDFRGYGQSGGDKQIDRIDRDVRAAVAFLKAQGAQRIVLVGASMGGTASAKVAGEAGAVGLIVLSSPRSFQGLEVTEGDLRVFNGPSLWIGSENDAATADVEALHRIANSPKELYVYPGPAHGTEIFSTDNGPDLTRRMIDFLLKTNPLDR